MIKLFIPGMFIEGIAEILKILMINLEQTLQLGIMSILSMVAGLLSNLIFLYFFDLGFQGVILSLWVYSLFCLGISLLGFFRYALPKMKQISQSRRGRLEQDEENI